MLRLCLAFAAVVVLQLAFASSASAQGCCKAGLCKIPQLPASSAASMSNSMMRSLDEFDNSRTAARQASSQTATSSAATGATEISIVNPQGSREKIEYVLDGKAYALEPGMSLSMRAAQARKIEFTRSADGKKAAYRVSKGVYEFAMTDAGWELYRTQR